MGFPMNLKRWTAYVACKPPNRGRVGAEKKRKMAVFRQNVHLSRRIVCYKVFMWKLSVTEL